jgi:hypothetical protein
VSRAASVFLFNKGEGMLLLNFSVFALAVAGTMIGVAIMLGCIGAIISKEEYEDGEY